MRRDRMNCMSWFWMTVWEVWSNRSWLVWRGLMDWWMIWDLVRRMHAWTTSNKLQLDCHLQTIRPEELNPSRTILRPTKSSLKPDARNNTSLTFIYRSLHQTNSKHGWMDGWMDEDIYCIWIDGCVVGSRTESKLSRADCLVNTHTVVHFYKILLDSPRTFKQVQPHDLRPQNGILPISCMDLIGYSFHHRVCQFQRTRHRFELGCISYSTNVNSCPTDPRHLSTHCPRLPSIILDETNEQVIHT